MIRCKTAILLVSGSIALAAIGTACSSQLIQSGAPSSTDDHDAAALDDATAASADAARAGDGDGDGGTNLDAQTKPATWTTVTVPGLATNLHGVWAAATSDVWVVGTESFQKPSAWRYDGHAWTSPLGTEGLDLRAVWGSAPNDVWAAAWTTTPALVHFDGTAWQRTASVIAEDIMRIWGTSAKDVWAVGASNTFHFDGQSWSKLPKAAGFAGVWGTYDDAWMVGSYGYRYHWHGLAWTMVPQSKLTYDLRGVWGVGPSDVWAVGDTAAAGQIQHYDGMSWTDAATAPGALTQITGLAADDAWSVGFNGTIMHLGKSGWSNVTSPTTSNLMDVRAVAPNDVWAVGLSGTVLHYTSD